jgi:hypothetical protein
MQWLTKNQRTFVKESGCVLKGAKSQIEKNWWTLTQKCRFGLEGGKYF